MAASIHSLDEADVAGKSVLVRVDLNIPMENGRIGDPTRIDRVLPTIREISKKGGRVVLLSHFGRPKNGPDTENSLRLLVGALSQRLGRSVAFAPDCIGPAAARVVELLRDGDVALLENTRFHAGEEKNDPAFVKALAALGELYVNDAFSAAHRAHASTEGLAHVLPCFAGRSMQAELEALDQALERPARPVAAIVGGAKVSTKLELIGNLSKKVDVLVIGGGMANTFLAAQGYQIGKSLCEKDLLATAKQVISQARADRCDLVLPIDCVTAKEFRAGAPHRTAAIEAVGADEMILDVGPRTIAAIKQALSKSSTLVWNGPLGAFELAPFDAGTKAIAEEAASLTDAGQLISVAGGGDTVAALNTAGVASRFTYLSTAGGAFLEWLEGKALPGVQALNR